MPITKRGTLQGKGKRILVAVSRFNEFLTRTLLEGCLDTLQALGVRDRDVTVVWVPGAFELPTALGAGLKRKYDAGICLGCVLRGETIHYEHVAAETARGIADAARTSGVPIAYGVVTAETLEQAVERAGVKMGNRGRDAALVAVEMANLLDTLQRAAL